MTVLYKDKVSSYTYTILKSLVLWGKEYAKAIKFDNFKMEFPKN